MYDTLRGFWKTFSEPWRKAQKPKMEFQTAIRVRGVIKRYGGKSGKVVLDQLDMNVKRGTIYGLLGASGCGKTTLLSAIVGNRKIDGGQIRILGRSYEKVDISSIGYMPQDIALVGEFSVKGAVQHYGWLFGMTNSEIDARYEFLQALLDLPPKDRLIKHLSGGQQRRVSLAVVLVHNPDILILDEPTVGLDPVLRQNIWDYLVQLTETEKKTIIITTHYIEEAKQAHAIGLMRNGKLLAEGPPATLMAKYNCNNVEDVFLLLSRKQQEGNVAAGERPGIEMEEVSLTDELPKDEEAAETYVEVHRSRYQKIVQGLCFTTSGHTKALFFKNYHKFVRNWGSIAYCFIFPIVQMTLFFITVGGDPTTVVLGVVTSEIGSFPNCKELAKNVTIGSKRVEGELNCSYTGLSCSFLLGLPDLLSHHEFYPTVESAAQAVGDGSVSAYIHFHKNFTLKTGNIRENLPITNRDVDEMQINIVMDKSNYPIARFLEKTLFDRYDTFSQELETSCGYNAKTASLPINKQPAVYSSYDAKFSEFMAPGFLLTCSIFLAVSVSALNVVTERMEGSWDRTLVAGVSKTEIVLFNFVTMAIVNVIQNALLFTLTFIVFGVTCRGNLVTALFLVTCQGIVGTAMGTFISVISKSVSDCILMSLGLFYPFLVLSGIVWPIEAMSPLLRQVSYVIIPSTISVEAVANVINRGWSITTWNVAKGFVSSISWMVFFNVLNIVILKTENR